MPLIKLQSSDGEVFQVDFDIVKASVTIKNMVEVLGLEDDKEIVPLPNVNAVVLKKVIQWATYHKDDPPPADKVRGRKKRTDDISSWDADFLKMNLETLKELAIAANYLEIKGLIELTCKAVANILKDKTPEEITESFNIQNDFTKSVDDQMRKEKEYCKEK